MKVPKIVTFSPEFLESYGKAMKEVRGETAKKTPQETVIQEVSVVNKEESFTGRMTERDGAESQPTIGSTTISTEEEAAIRTQVIEEMQKKIAVGQMQMGANPGLQNYSKSDAAILHTNVIDLITLSIASHRIANQLSFQDPRFQWLVPLLILGMEGTPSKFPVFPRDNGTICSTDVCHHALETERASLLFQS